METVDFIVHPEWIAPVVPESELLTGHSIAVRDGLIYKILPRAEMDTTCQSDDEFELPNQLLTPGLINAHGHAAMSLLRGYADDLGLMDWLNNHIWPAESKWVSENFVRDGAELAIAEMIRGGTTCFADMYFFPDATASAALRAGMRSQITFPILDFPSAWAKDGAEYIHKGMALSDLYKDHPLIQIAFGPHAPYTVADNLLNEISTYASELDAPIQIHLHETAFEVEESLKKTGQRPIERLRDRGILGPRTQCVHMTQITEADIELLLTWNSHVIHCPESNLKLASGFCPVKKLQDAGVNVAIGTDGAASNNDLNLLGETRTAALLAKAVAEDASALDAHAALEMATLNGAKAMGIDDKVGSLEVGKQADMVTFDLSGLESAPVYNPVSQLVYAASANCASHSWVGGKALLEKAKLLTIDSESVTQKAHHWAEKIKPRV